MGVRERYEEKRKKTSEENSSTQKNGVAERYQQKKYYSTIDTDNVDDNYINAFVSDANSFFSGVGDNSISYTDVNSRLNDLSTRYDTVSAWLYKNRKNLDNDTYSGFSSTLDSFKGNFDSIKNYYSQFENEEAYNEYYTRYGQYTKLANTEDATAGWNKYLEDENASAVAAQEKIDNEKWWETLGRYLGGVSDTTLPTAGITQTINDLRADDSYARPQDSWSEEQKKVFGALYLSNPSEAYQYATYTNNLINEAAEAEKIKNIADSATSSFGAGLAHSLGALVTAPLGLADYLADLTEANARGTITADGQMSPFEYSQAVTGGISDNLNAEIGTLDEDIPVIGGKGLGDLYGLGSSIAQSAMSAYVMGPIGTLVSYFGQGAASGVDEALARGASENQALLYGTAVGVFEGLAEQIGIDNLFKLDPSMSVKGFIKNILKQAGAEGAEEGLTSLLSNIADNVILQDKSNFYAMVDQLMAQGMNETEAKKKAWLDSVEAIVYDTIAGAVSGGVHAAPYTAVQTIKSNQNATKTYGDNTADLVNEALEINPNNTYAQNLKRKLDSGKTLTGMEINRLVEQNESAMFEQDTTAIRDAAADRLAELGEGGNVDAIAQAVAKQVSGEKLTRTEQRTISNSTYGQRVVNELNPQNITSEEYSSAWAEKIGTDRINPEEYSRLIQDTEIVEAEAQPTTVETIAQQEETEQTVQSVAVETQDSAGEAETISTTENATAQENASESEFSASADGTEEQKGSVTLEDVSKKYGAQAGAVIATYTEGQDVAKFDAAYSAAYNMGKSGVNLSYAMNSEATAYLSEKQRELAHAAGADASSATANAQDAENKAKANGKTGRRKGTVKGDGVTISDLKTAFNDTQNTAYKLLSTYADATGVDIVLFKSEANANGDFEGAQGRFKWNEDTIYIDINAGLVNKRSVGDLAQYTMLRTFSHEFTHFIEKWNPIWYNEFRKVVFDTLTERGENVNRLIEMKQAQTERDYDWASREVVAEAMTDILPDANFVEELATKHRNIFQKLFDMLKDFVSELKAHFSSLGPNSSREANALKEQVGDGVKYVESIVKLFDKVAVEAVENYQMTVSTEESLATDSKTEQVETETTGADIQNNTDGGIENVTDQEANEQGRTESEDTGSNDGTQEEDGNRSGVSEGNGGIRRDVSGLRGRRELNAPQKTVEATVAETDNSAIEASEKEYKKKYSPWLKRAGRRYILQYNGTSFLSDGNFALQATEEMVGWARFEFSGTMEERELPSPIADTLNNATTLLTNAPLEGKLGDKTVYVFEHDGKQKAVFDKKYLSKLDGNLLYIGDFVKGAKLLKAVDIDGNIVGFVLPLEVVTEVTATKPTKLKSFSNKMQSQIAKQEVKPNVENADNPSTVQHTESDRTGDSRVLDEVEAEDVQGDVQRRDTVGDAGKRGQQTARNDNRVDAERAGRRSSEGSSESGDLRRDDRLTDSETPFYDIHASFDDLNSRVSAEDIAAGIAKAKNEYHVTDEEVICIDLYVNGRAYDLSRLQRMSNGAEWSEFDTYLAEQISAGLRKHPVFKGRTYRNLQFGSVFDNENAYEDFLSENAEGKEVTLKAFTSASKDPNGYPIVGDKIVHLVIDGVNALDISETLNIGQKEVVYLPGTKYKVNKVTTANDGHPLIYGEEIIESEVQELSRSAESTGLRRSNETVSEGQGNDIRRLDSIGGTEASGSRSGEVEVHEPRSVHADQTGRLHEEVAEQIERQSTEQPRGRDFVIGESLDLPNGEKARYKANIEAIKLVKQLEVAGRYATEAEQTVLSKYVGWGGLANAFDQRKTEWAKEYAELKELLSEEEYTSARGSTLNAHFTDISVIKAMYDGLAKLGFNGGRMLEPSSGVGNFVGAMPTDMRAKVKSWTMVELDGITGLIAKYLYPNADMRIQGFEKANIPDNYMDVAISNVPFGNYAITDKAYPKKVTSAIHNYFFAKSLDKVRPGGIVMFITSSYTMNSKDSAVRRYIMQRADLLGAIRLPDSAFKGNAGTEVVTDILVLKKRAANTAYAGADFLESPYVYPVKGSYNGANINTYFTEHPEMVLGTASMDGGMYRGGALTYKAFEGRGSLADQIREAFSHIDGKMEYPVQPSREKTNFAVERANKKTKENGLVVKDGKVYQNNNGELVEVNTAKGTAERVSGMLEIRDAAKELMTYQQQGLKDSEISKARTKLNKLYDAFVKKHGYINTQTNKNAIKADPDCYSVYALENWNPETKKATKADIFSKNTIAPNRTVTSAKDVAEGLIVSVNQTGGVDVNLIARLTGKTEADVTRELIDSRKAFKNRNGELEAAEVYLSGNVRAKLRDAEALVLMDGDYKNNVEALKSVMPEDVGYQDIFVNPGTPWIPNSVYSDFAAYMLGGRNSGYRQDVDVTRNSETGNFTVELKSRSLKTNAANMQKWGTPRRSFLDLFDAMLNSKSVVIKDKLDDGSFVVNKDATAAAHEKIENIQKEFQEWLWRDEARRDELATLYNETFNSVVTPKYNGDHLTVNGANALKPLRQHQRNAVQRVISSGGNTLLAHKVGAGKTYEMAAAAMKLKELGLVKKPMFAVPKSLVAQWGNEFKDFFPTAKLLVAEASDFTASNRKVFMNRIANGEYDAVIVSYEQFEKLPMSDDFTRDLYQEQIDSIVAAIEEAKADKGDKALSVKDLEKKRKSLQAKIDKLTDKAKDEGNIDFEQLGVDSLFVDEAHNFKNLFYTTSMTNVSGLGNKDGSKRAFDLYTKVRYLQQLNGGRGIVFATATPVMNSMSEMYIMQKYLQPDLLNQLGLSTFDAWAKQFGEVVNGVEIKPSGQGYRVKQSFSRFKNMSELQLLFRNFADVLTDIPGLKIPTMKGGKVNVVVCEAGEFQQNYMKELEKRADNIKNVDPSEDNMLKITSDGRKISYTQRMIDPSLPYEEGCKIYRCADNVISAYNDSKGIKGTQLIFCDMATPKGKSNTNATETEDIETDMESAQLYDDLKTRLRQGGIPAKEIAFIHEADTDQKKKKLFADVNDGKVRVLIGSTGKMGVGMNAQKRVVAIHHLDAPWRPGDVEQRNGRAFRQGNINDEVECFTYVTEGSFDARLWDILERKQNFINQVMNGDSVGRETEDTGEVTLSAAEVKALASGSPLIMEQVQLDTDIKKLESLYRAHISAVRSAKERLSRDMGQIAMFENQIKNGKADISARLDTYSDDKFSITVGKAKYTDKKEAGVALMAEATASATIDGYTTIGNFVGFDLRVIKTSEGINGLLVGKQGYPFKTYSGNTTFMISQLIGVAESIDEKVKLWEHNLAETQKDIAEQEKLIAEPFAKQAELDQKRARYTEVMEILNPKEEQALDNVAEDTVQEQSREYLNTDEQEQQRTNTLTDREVLALAADELLNADMDMTEAERDALQIFRNRLTRLEELQNERDEQGRLYKEQQFGAKVDKFAAKETLNRMHVLDEQIKTAGAAVLSVEDKKVLGDVLKKARRVVESEQRSHDAEILKRWRDRTKNSAAIKKYRERIQKDVNELTSWVLKPNNKDITKHIPDVLKNSVIPFLRSIDFTSKQQLRGGEATKADAEFVNRLNALNAALKNNIDVSGLYSGYNDLPPNFMEKLQSFIDDVQNLIKAKSGEFVINKMTSEELKELSSVVKVLKAYVTQINKFHANAMYQHVYEAGDNTIQSLSAMQSDNGKSGGVSNFVLWQQIRPAFAFERFGDGGIAVYDGLRRGQAQLAFNTKEIVNFAEKTYTEQEVNAWEKEIKDIKLGDDIIKMPVSAIMSFYELSKQPDSLRHMLGEGIRVATYTVKGKKISDNGHALTKEDIATIISTLTPRQKEVADALQKYMAEQGGAWGNYVSVKRFGEELFGNPQYFPINSDGRHLQSTADEQPSAASLYALLNMSFTKSRNENANNRIILYSIFDVFANHMASMAQYNAMALPVLDAIKWFNYQQKTEDHEGNRYVAGSVRDQMERVYGGPEEATKGDPKGYAVKFVLNILKAFNGTEAQGVPTDATGMNAMRRYNMAQVAYNFRVVVQQPLAITRAALLIDYGSIIKGLKLKPAAIKQNIEEMQRYSGIAAWKSLGFYDTNISRGLTDTIKHKSSALDKISDVGMWGAEKADILTWAAMWSACKEDVMKKQKITPKDAGFYETVTKLFEDVIYKTQVVDSVLTKNEYLRSKGFWARIMGSFMSEPTTTASMVIDAVDKYNADLKRGMNRQQAWEKNRRKIGRMVYSYAVSAVILAAVQAVADAFRDDDDYETFMEKWLEAFVGAKFIDGNLFDELNPLNKLPLFNQGWEVIKELIATGGFDIYGQLANLPYTEIAENLIKGAEIINDLIAGEDTNYTWYGGIYKLLQAASGMFGLPMASATREIVTAWNNTVGAMAPSLKVKTYEPSALSEIKYAYADGYLTAEEATAQLLEQGLADNEDEAYFTIQGWEAGEGYSRYDALYEAVRNGTGFREAIDELVSHGYTEKEAYSKVQSKVGEWYRNGEISKAQAETMLERYTELDSDEITKAVNKWSSVVVTGIEYDDIADEFTAGNITASRAIEMYVRYGSMTKEKATEKVTVLSFVKEHPETEGISYAAVKGYTTYCEPLGMDASVFYDAWQYVSSTHADVDKSGDTVSGSKKIKVLAYINSLDLSARQKDGLYYALGYAESTINEAPWR